MNFLLRGLFAIIFIVAIKDITIANAKLLKEGFVNEYAFAPSVHASSIAEIDEGKFACVWFGGTAEKCPDTSIWISYYENGYWSLPIEIASDVDENGKRYPTWNPVITKSPSGRVYLFYKAGSSPRDWHGKFMYSDDNCLTWVKPQDLPEGFLGPVRAKPIYLDDETMLNPSSVENTSRSGWNIHFEAFKDDKWEKYTPETSNIDLYFFSIGIDAIQPSLIKMTNEHIVAICRTKQGFLAITHSYDSGKTWSKLEMQKNLPNPKSSADVILYKGKILMVHNIPTNDEGWRNKIVLSASEDLIDWQVVRVLDETSDYSEFSYPAIIADSEGKIHITYTYSRDKIKHIILDETL